MKPQGWQALAWGPSSWIFGASSVVASFSVVHPAPVLAWAAAQVGLVGLAWWRRRAPVAARSAGVPEGWEKLGPSQREQYRALRELRVKVEENLAALPGGAALEAVSQPRLDALLDDFARLLHTLNQYRDFLASADPRATLEEKEGLAAELEAATGDDAGLHEVKRRRLEILDQRLARIAQVRASRELVAHELAAVEDLVRLAYEQSVAIRDPNRAGDALTALAEQARAVEETVRELERFRDLGSSGRFR